MALDKQINLFRVDTNAFLNREEKQWYKWLSEIKKERKDLLKLQNNICKQVEDKTKKYDYDLLDEKIKYLDDYIKVANKIYKSIILKETAECVEYNNNHKRKHIRKLDEAYLEYFDKDCNRRVNTKNVVSMFESTLSRSFGIKTNELTYDIFILEIYYYDIAQDLILNGFDYNGKHYVYFSSSAGQIRTKKAVFVEEEKYKQCQNKLMCGLTIDKINEKGGMNINKFLAYLALSNSATDLWENVFGKNFDIDKSIVVDDFETMVQCKVDNIDYQTYEITPDVVQDMPIPHTDGCGTILSSYSKKNFMIRLPFIKGLLGSFDYVKFIKDNNCSSVVKDIWGVEHDVIEEDIQVIFTKSQLKMYKYYDSWEQYKEYFKMYECEACVCNMEEDKIPNAKINYQMLQTLHDISDEEIEKMCEHSNHNILTISDSLENMLRFFGVKKEITDESYFNWFQKALKIYPELLNDQSNKDTLKDLRNSMIKKYKGGKLEVRGKFTFVLPDLYAFCEWLFMGIKTPKGLLENKEVYCRLYKNSKELDCLRSPHLYIEHAVRNNVCGKKYRNQRLEDWFQTDAIYTSTHDLISRILQFDVDGDRLLVLAQKDLIEIAKRNMIGVNPLYYEMKKAKAEHINPQTMYNGLKLAFTGGNIGTISNDITKIWNQDLIGEEELKAIRWLCMETNFTIDYAKTLFKPTRPEYVDIVLKSFGKEKVPYFFQYAKGKDKKQCEDSNNSMMNRIVKTIKQNKLMFNSIKNLSSIDYTMLLKDRKDIYTNPKVDKIFLEWNRIYGNNLKMDKDDSDKNNINIIVSALIQDLHNVEKDDNKIINSLVSLLYKTSSTRKKNLLWLAFGEQMYSNLVENIDQNTEVCLQCGKRVKKGTLVRDKCLKCRNTELKDKGTKTIQCIDCGVEIEVPRMSRTCRCDDCLEKRKREIEKTKKANYRAKIKMST